MCLEVPAVRYKSICAFSGAARVTALYNINMRPLAEIDFDIRAAVQLSVGDIYCHHRRFSYAAASPTDCSSWRKTLLAFFSWGIGHQMLTFGSQLLLCWESVSTLQYMLYSTWNTICYEPHNFGLGEEIKVCVQNRSIY